MRELLSYFEASQIEIEHILMKRFELNNLLDGSPGLGGGLWWRCIRDYAVILAPVRRPLGRISCFLAWNFFAPTSFLLPPSLPPPKLGLLRIARRRKLDGGKYITVQMTAPIDGHAITDGEDDFSLTFYIFFSQIWGKQDNPAWYGWQHTYKMLKNVGKQFRILTLF